MAFDARDAEKDLTDDDDEAEHSTARPPAPQAISEPPTSSGTLPRPTVRPLFDPAQYAEASEIRERAETYTDEVELERARMASFRTDRPPPRMPADSSVEINMVESDMDALSPEEQVELLRENMSPLTRVPMLATTLAELGELLEDPKTAYVLGFVDGVLPLDTILDVTGLPELDTLRIFDRMTTWGAVVFRDPKKERA